jgi:hypothetical protein
MMRHSRLGATFQATVIGIGSILAIGSASAASVTAGTPTLSSSNLGTGTPSVYGPSASTQNISSNRDYESSTVNVPSSEVVIAPTETTSGLMYLYSTPQTTTTWVEDSWKRDTVEIDVNSSGGNKSGGKWISIAGTVTSDTALDIRFSMTASGIFDPIQTPFGLAAPPLASFYFGEAAVGAVPSSSTNADIISLTYSANTFSSQFGTTTFTLAPGVAQPFAAFVYAGQDVSIGTFDLTGITTLYDYALASRESVFIGNRVLVGAAQIAPIPEAEPALILAAGLGAVAALARRRRRAVAQC